MRSRCPSVKGEPVLLATDPDSKPRVQKLITRCFRIGGCEVKGLPAEHADRGIEDGEVLTIPSRGCSSSGIASSSSSDNKPSSDRKKKE